MTRRVATRANAPGSIMAQWNIRPSAVFILSGVIFLMLLIVVLPDVDLPDAAFHGGTAPVLVHAQAVSAPAAMTIIAALHFPDAAGASRPFYEPGTLTFSPRPNSRPILLRSIRR